jgi:hypothetical protein
LLTGLLELKVFLGLFENIANHHLNGLIDHIEVIIFIEFIPGVEDVVDYFYVFCGVANLFVYDASLVEE